MTLSEFLQRVLELLRASKAKSGRPILDPICAAAAAVALDGQLNFRPDLSPHYVNVTRHLGVALSKRDALYIPTLVARQGKASTMETRFAVTNHIRERWLLDSIATGVLQRLPDDAQIMRLLEQLK